MFHWICPECGCEIPPAVKECPRCEPAYHPDAQSASAAEPVPSPAPEPEALPPAVEPVQLELLPSLFADVPPLLAATLAPALEIATQRGEPAEPLPDESAPPSPGVPLAGPARVLPLTPNPPESPLPVEPSPAWAAQEALPQPILPSETCLTEVPTAPVDAVPPNPQVAGLTRWTPRVTAHPSVQGPAHEEPAPAASTHAAPVNLPWRFAAVLPPKLEPRFSEQRYGGATLEPRAAAPVWRAPQPSPQAPAAGATLRPQRSTLAEPRFITGGLQNFSAKLFHERAGPNAHRRAQPVPLQNRIGAFVTVITFWMSV